MDFELKNDCVFYDCDCHLNKSWKAIDSESFRTHTLELSKNHPKPVYRLSQVWHCTGDNCLLCIGYKMGLPLCEVWYAHDYLNKFDILNATQKRIVDNWKKNLNYDGRYIMVLKNKHSYMKALYNCLKEDYVISDFDEKIQSFHLFSRKSDYGYIHIYSCKDKKSGLFFIRVYLWYDGDTTPADQYCFMTDKDLSQSSKYIGEVGISYDWMMTHNICNIVRLLGCKEKPKEVEDFFADSPVKFLED